MSEPSEAALAPPRAAATEDSPLDRGWVRWAVVALFSATALFVWYLLVEAERAQATPSNPLSIEAIEKRLGDDPLGIATIVLTKLLVAVAGAVVLILYLYRRSAIRRGLLAPPPSPERVLFSSKATALAVVVVVTLFFGSRVVEGLRPRGDGPVLTQGDLLLTAAVGLGIGVAVVAARALRARGTRRLPLRGRLAAAGRVFLVSGLLVLVLGYVAVAVLDRVFGIEPLPQELVREMVQTKDRSLVLSVAVYGVVAAPFAEEAMFRALLYPALRGLAGRTVAALWVSILFAAIHLDGYAYLPLLGLSLLLVGLFEATDSILAVTLVHALNNLSSILPILVLRTTS